MYFFFTDQGMHDQKSQSPESALDTTVRMPHTAHHTESVTTNDLKYYNLYCLVKKCIYFSLITFVTVSVLTSHGHLSKVNVLEAQTAELVKGHLHLYN